MPRSCKTTASAQRRRATKQPGRILDLFAGAGGWEEALAMLGLTATGIETDPWACQTARAAGHERLQADVAQLDPLAFGPVWGLVGSPPCQSYSTAGKGLGRLDKPLVIACAHELAAGKDTRHAHRQECRDPRSLLTIEPLRYALALKPRWVALEQVPAVLELWSIFAALLASHGYHATAGVLSAERYGVAQTRKRAFLIASLDAPVSLPQATHRSYDPRRPEPREDESALEPWVSMAQALGWDTTATVHTNNQTRGGRRPRGLTRPLNAPAHTLDTSSGSWTLDSQDPIAGRGGPQRWAWRNGNRPHTAVRASGLPAPTVHFGDHSNEVAWVACSYETRQRSARPRAINRPAPTMLAAGLAKGTPAWTRGRPATTVSCDRRVHPPGHKHNREDPPGRYEQRRGANAVRVTVQQAAILQGFPAGYPWHGSRSRQFRQVGNAVPPPLALRVIEQAIKASRPAKPRRAGGRKGGDRSTQTSERQAGASGSRVDRPRGSAGECPRERAWGRAGWSSASAGNRGLSRHGAAFAACVSFDISTSPWVIL